MALSPGCTAADRGLYNPNGTLSGVGGGGQFAAGERITASAGPPESAGHSDRVTLYVDDQARELPSSGTLVACVAFPGTVGYTFLADGIYTWFCEVVPANATWTINCGVAPPPDPAQEITDLKARVDGIMLARLARIALIRPLDVALEALTVDDDTAAACHALQLFINRVLAAFWAGQLTRPQECELHYSAETLRKILNCPYELRRAT